MVVLVMTVFDIGDPEDIDLFSMAWRGRAPYECGLLRITARLL